MPILASPMFSPTSTPTSSPAFLTHLIHTLTCPVLAHPPSYHACTQEHHLAHSNSSLPSPCLHPHLTCAHMHTACLHHSCHVQNILLCHHSPRWISLASGQDPLDFNGDLFLYMWHC